MKDTTAILTMDASDSTKCYLTSGLYAIQYIQTQSYIFTLSLRFTYQVFPSLFAWAKKIIKLQFIKFPKIKVPWNKHCKLVIGERSNGYSASHDSVNHISWPVTLWQKQLRIHDIACFGATTTFEAFFWLNLTCWVLGIGSSFTDVHFRRLHIVFESK